MEEINESKVQEPAYQEQKPKRKKGKKIALSVIALLIVLIAAGGAYLAYGPTSTVKEKILSKIPYPITMVGGKPIFYKEVQKRLEVAKKSSGDSDSADTAELKSKIVDNLVEEQKLSLAADKNGVAVSNQDIQSLYDKTVESATNGDKGQFQKLLSDFGLTDDQFKNDILKPQALFTNLVVWYNSNKDLNKDAYDRAEQVGAKIKNGESFESLAKQFSDDTSTKDLEGDMGTVNVAEILPELSNAISPMGQGDVKLVTSRYGLHYIKVESKDAATNEYHIKQIFFEPKSEFKQWFDSQESQFKVIHIVKNI